MKKRILVTLLAAISILTCLSGCEALSDANYVERENTLAVGRELSENQATPTDIEYSLERYNLIRRAYFVNGMEEKASTLPCPVEKPLGYVVLMLEGVGIVDSYVVDGKITSLNSYLTPESEYYSSGNRVEWLPDTDGAYGQNDSGIFFFTADGHYKEWNGHYLYSDTPMHIENPILTVKEAE